MDLDFPVGTILADRWRITEALYGGPDRGVYRGDGVLMTMGGPQPLSYDELAARFALSTPGVTRLLGATSLRHAGMRYDVLVEAEPAGAPLTARRGDAPMQVAASLAGIVASAHANGYVLGGIRPELAYSDGVRCTGIAPRAEPFHTLAERREYGVAPCFPEVYASPEVLSLQPVVAASDVFSLCATIVYLLDGAPPFAGETVMERMSNALRGVVRSVNYPEIVRQGLNAHPTMRPPAEAIARTLS